MSALLFFVLYGIAMFVPTLPEGGYSDQRVLGMVNNDSGPIVVGGYALAAAGLMLLWFTAALASRLRDEESSLPGLITVGGGAYGVLLMVASTSFSTIALGRTIGELPVADDAFLVRAVSNQGFHLILVPGLLCAGLVVLAVSLLGRRTGALPGWCSTFGFVVAPLLLLGFAWAPQFLVPIWAVVVAFAIRSPRVQSGTVELSRSAAV